MRVAADTNVLVRLLMDDDQAQADSAERALLQADQILVTIPVLCEVAWVLHRSYHVGRRELAMALRDLVRRLGAEVDDAAFQAGLAMLEQGGDLADGVIAYQAAQARCDQVVTFDKDFARIGGRIPVTLLTG